MIKKIICCLMILNFSYGLQSREEKIRMLREKNDPRILIPKPLYNHLTFAPYILTESNKIQKKLAELYGQSTFSINNIRQIIMNQAKHISLNPIKGKKCIPYLTHRLWITNLENPSFPPEDSIQKYLQSIKNLGKEWTHYFWCQDIGLFPSELKHDLEKNHVILKTIDDIETMKGQKVIDFYLNHQQYCFASDIIRLNIVYQEGGVYSDIGWVLKDFSFVCDQFDHFFYHLAPQQFDRNLFGCNKKSVILEKMLEKLDDFSWISEEIKDQFEKDPLSQQVFIGHDHLNVIGSLLKPKESALLILSPKNSQIFEPYRLGSWGEKKKFGNIDFTENKDNVLKIYDSPT